MRLGSQCLGLLLSAGCTLNASANCGRIVSIDPSGTEILKRLQLEHALVGRDAYSKATVAHPVPVVGDFFSLNYEVLISLAPDLVISSQSLSRPDLLKAKNIRDLSLDYTSIDMMWQSIKQLAVMCHRLPTYEKLYTDWAQAWHDLQQIEMSEQTYLLVFGMPQPGEAVYTTGAGVYAEVLQHLGLRNAYTGSLTSAGLDQETVYRLNPSSIIYITDQSMSASSAPTQGFNQTRQVFVLNDTQLSQRTPWSLLALAQQLVKIRHQSKKN